MKTIQPNNERLSGYFKGDSPELINEEYQAFITKIGESKHQELIDTIQDHNLLNCKDDLLCLSMSGILIPFHIKMEKLFKGINRQYSKDLHQAMELINSSKIDNITITISRKGGIEQKVTINSELLTRSILKLIRKKAESGTISPESITKPKGRKPKHEHIGMTTDLFQRYLQKYTHLKAEEGISISNDQARFISEVLYILNLIDIPPDSYDIDYIRKYLAKYRTKALKIRQEKSP